MIVETKNLMRNQIKKVRNGKLYEVVIFIEPVRDQQTAEEAAYEFLEDYRESVGGVATVEVIKYTLSGFSKQFGSRRYIITKEGGDHKINKIGGTGHRELYRALVRSNEQRRFFDRLKVDPSMLVPENDKEYTSMEEILERLGVKGKE